MSVTRQNPYQMLFLDTIKISWVSPFFNSEMWKVRVGVVRAGLFLWGRCQSFSGHH
jgi:hypothetical protein